MSAQYSTVWVNTECDTPVTGYSRLEDLVVDSMGRVIVTGTLDTLQDFGPIFMAYDSSGQQLWKKSMGGFNFNFSYRMQYLPNGNYLFAGEYEDATGTNNMIYSEWDAIGDSITGGILNAPGMNTGDDLKDAAIDSKGNVYLSGIVKVGNNFPAAVARYDTGGVFRWLSSYPLLPGWNSAMARCIEMTGDTGMYLLVFNFTGFASLLYCDTAGVFQWQTTLPISLDEYHTQLATDPFGNAIAGGKLNNQSAGIVKVDPAGDTLWSRPVIFPGLNSIATNVVNVQTDAAGNSYALAINSGNPGYSLIGAFDMAGNQLWVDSARGYSNVYGRNKEFLHLENGVLTFVTTKGGSWLYRYTIAGARITDAPLNIPGLANPEVNALDYFNNDLYMTGTSYAGFNQRLGFTARLSGLVSATTEINRESEISVYPNPAGKLINIKCLRNCIGKPLLLYDFSGRVVKKEIIQSELTTLDIESVSSGIYLLKVGEPFSKPVKIFKQ